ncbi:MAG: hypothetical protein K0U37_07075 [Gammaproteobacteria bacterium]|nr:hypothetical protein [Gammaproteobacteria bacterium]
MRFEVARAEFKSHLIKVINEAGIGILKAHMALSNPGKTRAIQITEAIIQIQEVRSTFALARAQFVALSKQYLEAGKRDNFAMLASDSDEMNRLTQEHTKWMKGFALNEAYLLAELERRSKENITGASELEALSLFAKEPGVFSIPPKPNAFDLR